MNTICLMNNKGGVGKTTTTINVAYCLSKKAKVLIIDCDSQSNLSNSFGITEPSISVYDLFKRKSVKPINVRKNLDIIPSTGDFAGADLIIQNEFARELILKKQLNEFKELYDYVFIDCPPSLNLVTINALSASDYVIIPVEASAFSMSGVSSMIEFTTSIKEMINPDINILGLLITKYDKRLKLATKILKQIEEKGWERAFFKTKIRINTTIAASQDEQKPILEYDSKSHGAIDYVSLTKEIINRVKNGL